jgi:hypothetical protein
MSTGWAGCGHAFGRPEQAWAEGAPNARRLSLAVPSNRRHGQCRRDVESRGEQFK